MKAPVSWLKDYADLPADLSVKELADRFTALGLNVERIEKTGGQTSGPVVFGRVLNFIDEPQKNGKTIRWCQVDVGEHNGEAGYREIVCGADNFEVGDRVVVSLPGSVLVGGFEISARKTYGHISDGMICAVDELGIGTDHTGILVVGEEVAGEPVVLGKPAMGLLDPPDDVFDIDVTPDLSYCLSLRGLAREAAGAYGVAFSDPVAFATPEAGQAGYPVHINDDRCQIFAAVTVTGVDPTRPSPEWLQSRLRASGMRSISLIVDITNFVMLESGQPLHGYDLAKLQGPIVVRPAVAGEKLQTLDDQVRTLRGSDMVIADDSGAIGLAGVMGGASTEIDAETTDVVLEGAWFEPAAISSSFRHHKLPSEASKRFERGTDPATAFAAAWRAALLMAELAGGTVSEAVTIAGSIPPVPPVRFAASLPGQILGMEVPAERVTEILRGVEVDVVVEGEMLVCTPPTWRNDLRDPYDFVEEVGCKIGYDALPVPVPPRGPGGGLTRAQQLRRRVNEAAVSAGYVELITLPFASAEDIDKLGVAEDDPRRALVRIANPLADTTPYLRSTLLPGLFAAVAKNLSRGNTDLALYETGSVFRAKEPMVSPRPSVTKRPSDAEAAALTDSLAEQPRLLAGVVCGNWVRPGWTGAGKPADWTHAVALAEAVAQAAGVRLTRRNAEYAPWHPGRCAELLVDGESIGHAGELHPQVIDQFDLPAGACALELNVDRLIELAPSTGEIRSLSAFPVAKEDVALEVDASVPVAELAAALREGAGELCEDVRLFDIYSGSQIGEGKRSCAFALRFRAPDRTLKDAETAEARDAAVALCVERFGAVHRA